MDFGLTGKLSEYYLGSIYKQSKATGKREGVSFQDAICAKATEKVSGQINVTGISFKDMWQARFPGAKYHVFDASKIPMGVWCRNDFPVEKFFQDDVDESVLEWNPIGAEPDMADASVQNRLNSVLGQYVINVPPELEEKMKNDSSIAKKIMNNIDELFAWNGHPVPGRINGGVICLDENGEVARWNLISGGGRITQSSSEMVEAYYRRREKQEEYEQIAAENADSVAEGSKTGAISTKDMTMEEYKAYISEKISQIPMHPTRIGESISITISEAGFEAMKNDPELAKEDIW